MSKEQDNIELSEIVERLEDIRNEIGCLNDEALDLTRTASKILHVNRLYEAAKAYWHAHVEGNIIGEKYPGSMENLPDTIQEILDNME